MTIFQFTKRKFYNKWNYKISLKIQGASIFRMYDLDHVKEILQNGQSINLPLWQRKIYRNTNEALIVVDFLSRWLNKDYGKRIEKDSMDLYTNDKKFFDEAVIAFMPFVKKSFSPDPKTEHLLSTDKKIISKKLPHGKYKYKVYLQPHKFSDTKEKLKFLKFLKNYKDKILISEKTSEWFLITKWNWDRRYILVDDEKTLMILKLYSSSAVGSTYEYIALDK